MSNNDDSIDGGPAFPCNTAPPSHALDCRSSGMTLRDWFAGIATDEDIKHHLYAQPMTEKEKSLGRSPEDARYRFADAMLAARTRRDGEQLSSLLPASESDRRSTKGPK